MPAFCAENWRFRFGLASVCRKRVRANETSIKRRHVFYQNLIYLLFSHALLRIIDVAASRLDGSALASNSQQQWKLIHHPSALPVRSRTGIKDCDGDFIKVSFLLDTLE